MKDTTFVLTQEQWARTIYMHNRVDGKSCAEKMLENRVFSVFPCTHYLGGAGLVSTLADYSKFAQMLLNKEKTLKKQIINEDTFRLLHTPFVSKAIMPGSERWGARCQGNSQRSLRKFTGGSLRLERGLRYPFLD